MTEMKSVQVVISGRVQGVGFRAWTKSNARQRSLDGWVRNRSDQTVEAVFRGEAKMVEDMLRACEDGPLASRVKDISVADWTEPVARGFEQRETMFSATDKMRSSGT